MWSYLGASVKLSDGSGTYLVRIWRSFTCSKLSERLRCTADVFGDCFFHYISSWGPGEERWGRGSDTRTPFRKWPEQSRRHRTFPGPWKGGIHESAELYSQEVIEHVAPVDFRPLSHVKYIQILTHAIIMELKEFKVSRGATFFSFLSNHFDFPVNISAHCFPPLNTTSCSNATT